ncbi:MAG: GNAT family N-acetyltransferase [Myxococcota bacterium]
MRHLLRDGTVLVLRTAVPDDAEALLEHADAIARETVYTSYGPGEMGMTLDEERAFIERYARESGELFLVAEVDGEIVGSLTFAAGRRSRTCHGGEFGMAVRRAWWRRGIGAILLDALLAWGRAHPVVTRITLRVRCDNTPAMLLYATRGFEAEGRLVGDFVLEGVEYDHFAMAIRV